LLSASPPIARSAVQEQIEHLWSELAHDHPQRAEVCARLCQEQAPHLVEWLKAKILVGISDRELLAISKPPVTDGRILAYSQLCQIPTPISPRSKKLTAPLLIKKERAGRSKEALKPFEATYQAIFGVVPEVLPETPLELRVEPEIGRICIGLNKASEYRLYIIARELTRSADGSGKVAKQALRGVLKRYGITYSREHFNRLLRAGNGAFWNLSQKHVYIRSYKSLASKLATLAPELFTTNRPGVRDIYLSPAGSHEQWEAMLYAAWLAYRNNPTIARATLETLFRRSPDTLRRWEQTRLQTVVSVRANDVQCPHPLHEDDRYFDHIPEHSQPYVAQVHFQGQWQRVIRIRWRTSNTYQVSAIRQHHRRGQASKVRKAINDLFELPAADKRGGTHPLRRYFDNAKHLKDYTAKHDSMGYLWRGENRRGRGIFEINNKGFWFTHANERTRRSEELACFSSVSD
jgi:hypothetical protein